MDVDLIRADSDAVDQGSQEGSLACSGQLCPALADFRGARNEPALRRQIGKLFRLVDAGRIEKPLAHSAGYEVFDLRGWDTQPGRSLGPIFGDQRARNIVAVACAPFDRIARRHPVALGVEEHSGEQAWLVSAGAAVALGRIAGKPPLN